jgi:hypothetical protein
MSTLVLSFFYFFSLYHISLISFHYLYSFLSLVLSLSLSVFLFFLSSFLFFPFSSPLSLSLSHTHTHIFSLSRCISCFLIDQCGSRSFSMLNVFNDFGSFPQKNRRTENTLDGYRYRRKSCSSQSRRSG